MKITLKIWRQKSNGTKGSFKEYKLDHVSADMSFLEMLDVLNNDLILKGEEPVAFDHDCREGVRDPPRGGSRAGTRGVHRTLDEETPPPRFACRRQETRDPPLPSRGQESARFTGETTSTVTAPKKPYAQLRSARWRKKIKSL